MQWAKESKSPFVFDPFLFGLVTFPIALKDVSATFLLVCFLSLNESTCETKKNVLILLQKLLSFLRKSNFIILHFLIS